MKTSIRKSTALKFVVFLAVVATVLGLSLGTTSTASATVGCEGDFCGETSKLTAFKFNDLNANGQYDEGEPPLAGWEFCLLKENGDPYPNAAGQICRTTNSSGFATFSNLPVGWTFKIAETVQPGWTVTTPNPQGDTVESGAISGVPGPNPATIGGFTIVVTNPSPNTWVYTLPKNASPPSYGLSHWVLGIGTCRDHVVSYSPTSGFEDFDYQNPTGYYGIKWNTSWESGETSRSFTIVLDDHYPAGTVQATVKYGPKHKTGDILGPICYPRFGNVQAGSLTVTKTVELNGWDADSTTFDICIQGPSYPTGAESDACHAFSGGESYTWQGLQAGDYTVTETNPDAANWTVTGEGAVTVAQGQNATKTITNTRKMNDVTVTKTATTVYTRTNTYEWDIDKTVDPTQADLFEGESTVLTYTVSVTPNLASQVDSGHRVFGDITVANPGPAKTRVASVTDILANATCPGVTFPKELAAGESFVCSYAADLPGAISGTNVATATLTNQSNFTGSAGYAFGEPATTINGNVPITVTDTYTIGAASNTETLGTGIGSTWSDTYTREATCSSDLNYVNGVAVITADNVARIVETGDEDDAQAIINCYRPSVSKTAVPAYATTYEWDIDKTVTPLQTDLIEGESTSLNYTVTVTRSLGGQSYRVDGLITVVNPNPTKALSLTSVTDQLNTGQALSVNCPASVVPAGGSLDCTYGDALPDSATVTNTATIVAATGIQYASAGVLVDFTGVTPSEINPSVTVTDTQPSSLAPWTFGDSGSQSYSHQVTCNLNAFEEGNSYNIPVANTATIDQTGQSASANANVTCWVGDLEVIKVVNWGSATPDQGKTFEICVTGPSFPQGDCKNVDFDGGVKVWQDLIPGTYTVVETDPGVEWTVSGNNVQVNVPAGGSAQATITNSTVIPASLGDFVWEDKNQNGIQDEGEPGIPNVVVTLHQPGADGVCGTEDDSIVGTTATDANGQYIFTDLLPGDYCVQVTPPPDFDFTIPNAGDDPTKNSKVDPSTGMTPVITLNPGDNDPNQDAGLFNTQPTGLEEGDQPASNMLYLPMLGR